jgi:hypothetical protein
MTKDEKAETFIKWLNGLLKSNRVLPEHKVPVIHEVAYKFHWENRFALRARHLNGVRLPTSYRKRNIKFFTDGSGYLGYTIRMT